MATAAWQRVCRGLGAGVLGVGLSGTAPASDTEPLLASPEPRTLVVALDGSGQFTSIQVAVDEARTGDTVVVRAGIYAEDVVIHSKERITIAGESSDRVTVSGRDRFGSFHIGKWPYGATGIEISGLTIKDRGGLALGIYNGRGILLRDMKIDGMLFGQQVRSVRVEHCVIGGSETTGVQFADSEAVLIDNLIHDNDHGIKAAGRSQVRLERNVITRHLFEGVVVTDQATAVVVRNTIVRNGGGAAFLSESQSDVSGNVVGLNKVGFVIAATSKTTLSFNDLYNEENYLAAGTPHRPAPELKSASDLTVDPRFVDPERGDFRLRPDTPLLRVGGFPYLGALEPLKVTPEPLSP